MVSGCVVGTISTAIWLPFFASNSFSVWSSAATSRLLSVAVLSTTRPVSGGTATSAVAANAQHSISARKQALAAFIAGAFGCLDYFAGAGVAGAGLKSTFGAVEISFSFSTEKFGFSL